MESLPLAGLLGLLLQAALATALLRFWLRQGESFYLLNVGNASGVVYVVELVAWVVGFMLLILGRVRAATSIADHLLEIQDPSGAWLTDQPAHTMFDQTAEIAIWLKEVSAEPESAILPRQGARSLS
jgi:hypothetical protein